MRRSRYDLIRPLIHILFMIAAFFVGSYVTTFYGIPEYGDNPGAVAVAFIPMLATYFGLIALEAAVEFARQGLETLALAIFANACVSAFAFLVLAGAFTLYAAFPIFAELGYLAIAGLGILFLAVEASARFAIPEFGRGQATV